MKRKIPTLNLVLIGCLVMTISLIIYKHYNIQKEIIKTKETKEIKETSNLISMMLEQPDGTYSESEDYTWPKEDFYIINESLSGCEKGSKLNWDNTKKTITVSASSSDKCYAYFDLIFAKTFEFTNSIQTVEIPLTATYKLEV